MAWDKNLDQGQAGMLQLMTLGFGPVLENPQQSGWEWCCPHHDRRESLHLGRMLLSHPPHVATQLMDQAIRNRKCCHSIVMDTQSNLQSYPTVIVHVCWRQSCAGHLRKLRPITYTNKWGLIFTWKVGPLSRSHKILFAEIRKSNSDT